MGRGWTPEKWDPHKANATIKMYTILLYFKGFGVKGMTAEQAAVQPHSGQK